tara:strand:- start:533 stop:859 length:327 start_codon:yes stop_codon:yes gene_type:complete
MAEIIDLTAEINKRAKRNLEKIKQELEIEIQKLNFNVDKEINKFVIFDTSNYYELSNKDTKQIVTEEKAMKLLLTAFDMLVKLNKLQAATEIENIITRLENNSYEGNV